jgi:hypothetical protein
VVGLVNPARGGFDPCLRLNAEKALRGLRGGVTIHIFLAVLIWGTLWRLSTYHLMASANTNVNHIGKAMSIQY